MLNHVFYSESAGSGLPAHLGIEGESNGGMVMGAVLVQKPEILGAAVLEVPDLDMLRYTVLNGYQHTEELGSPDVPAERIALRLNDLAEAEIARA